MYKSKFKLPLPLQVETDNKELTTRNPYFDELDDATYNEIERLIQEHETRGTKIYCSLANCKNIHKCDITNKNIVSFVATEKDRVGKGAFANVYKTNIGGTMYAMKEIQIKDEIAANILQTAIGEFQIMKKLSECNDNIVKIFDWGIHLSSGTLYVMYEYLDGYIDLQKYVDLANITTDAYIQNIPIVLNRLFDGLRCIHRHNVAHRDIKPGNIMIHPATLAIKYIDFGLSCADETLHEKHCSKVQGTNLYRNAKIDIIVDRTRPDEHMRSLAQLDLYALLFTCLFVVYGKMIWIDSNDAWDRGAAVSLDNAEYTDLIKKINALPLEYKFHLSETGKLSLVVRGRSRSHSISRTRSNRRSHVIGRKRSHSSHSMDGELKYSSNMSNTSKAPTPTKSHYTRKYTRLRSNSKA